MKSTKNMKNYPVILILAGLLSTSTLLFAASHAGAPTKAAIEMSDAEVRKIDKENKKITLKHGVIKNLDMPGMTMVFQVKDTSLLDNIKAGDKIKFTADNVNGAITVLSVQKNP
jgi:Cu/Ag efflux protein CusF